MRECVAVRHLPFEDLGYFEWALQEAGWSVRYVDAPTTAREDIESLSPDLLVVLGGPLGANDTEEYPFLATELRLLEKRIEKDRPTLGICLGGQLIARALGAKVAPAMRAEIGWLPLQLTVSGEKSPLRNFDNVKVFHWHGDAFDLPEHAVALASTPDCPHQAFCVGANILGLQFHPEITPQGLETWYVGHYRALRDPATPDVHALREDAARYGAQLQKSGRAFLEEWLSQLTSK
ncbi:MAG: glutamine amidotransferase [Proteobacteria bacterium]|nr:glutamine amidotransferase [Pseudomonadota bacterium]